MKNVFLESRRLSGGSGSSATHVKFAIQPANPQGNPTVIGLIAHQVFTRPLFFMYPVFQFATLLILTLAANTSYSDFPRVASLLARDNFLPHQFAFRGDRLAFSTGILFLAALACLLLRGCVQRSSRAAQEGT